MQIPSKNSPYGRIRLHTPVRPAISNSIAVQKVVYDDAAEIPEVDPTVPAGAITELNVEEELISLGGEKVQQEWQEIQADKAAYCGLSHVSEVVHRLTLADIAESQANSSLAFDGLSYRNSIPVVEYYKSPTSVMVILHGITEATGRIPTWDEFIARMHGGDLSHYWWTPLVDKVGPSERMEQASRHRLATFYYAWVRELHLAAYLRENHNIHLRSHPTADVGLKVDFWIGNIALSVFLCNYRFRTAYSSEKRTSKELFEGSRFHHIQATLSMAPSTATGYSKQGCFFFTDEALNALAAEIRTILNTAKE